MHPVNSAKAEIAGLEDSASWKEVTWFVIIFREYRSSLAVNDLGASTCKVDGEFVSG